MASYGIAVKLAETLAKRAFAKCKGKGGKKGK